MKNLFYIVIIITLPLIAFFQFRNWRKFHPPKDYTEQVSPEVDANYHQPELVLEYYQSLQEAATYARHVWRKHRVDVRSESPLSEKNQIYLKTHQQYLAKAQMIKQKLIHSAQLKKQGFSNLDVQWIEENGEVLSPEIMPLLHRNILAVNGDKNPFIAEIQRSLVEKGYDMPVDGFFKQETEDAIKAFQSDNGLLATGLLDKQTVENIFAPVVNQPDVVEEADTSAVAEPTP